MSESTLPKRILTLGMPSDYPPEFREISAACDFAIAVAPDGQVSVVKDRQGSVPRPPTVAELLSVQPVMPGDVARILGGGNGNGQRPAPRFAHDDRITPGPDSTLGYDVGTVGKVLARAFCGNCDAWHYLVQFEGGETAQMLEARMRPAEEVEAADQHASPRDGSADYAHEAIEAPQPDGWQGTVPAEGTRRATILDAIRSCPDGTPMSPLELTDRIESALLRATIDAEAMERGAEALTDGIEKVEPSGHSLAGLEVEKALNHLILARRETVDPEELDRINHAITATHMVIEPPSDPDKERELREGPTSEDDPHGFSGAFNVMVGEDGAYVSIDSLVQILSQLGDESEERYEDFEPEPGEVQPGFRVEGSQLSPLARFLDFLGVGR